MANYFVFLSLLGIMVFGIGNPTFGAGKTKRSDILVHDVVQQMVAEQIERQKILKEFRGMKHELSDVKRELKERNTLMKDTKFLQKKFLREMKHMKEEVKQLSKTEVKKEMSSFKQQMLARTKKLWKNIKLNEKAIKVEKGYTKREIGEIRKINSKDFKSIHTVIADLQNKTSNSGKEVAFSATLLAHTTFSSAIVFNNVITNLGGGYNNRDGMFHCPKPGVYLFSYTVTAHHKSYVVAYLMKNHNTIARAHENSGHNAYPSASLTVVLRLTKGDKVWIKGYGIKYYAPDNAFTGVLIKP